MPPAAPAGPPRPLAQRLARGVIHGLLAFGMVCYGLGGLVHGHTSTFVLDGFAPLRGLAGTLVALSSVALGLRWFAANLRQQVLLRDPKVRPGWMDVLTMAGLTGFGLALLAGLVVPSGSWLDRSWAIDEQSVLPLLPTLVLWPAFLPLAGDRMWFVLFFAGMAAFAALLVTLMMDRPRIFTFSLGLMLLAIGLGFLGEAAFQFVSARQLHLRADAQALAAYRHAPGAYNAWTVACQWFGLWGLGSGIMMLYAAFEYPPEALRSLRNAWRQA